MNKTIWIMNHYATTFFFDGAGRHYSFAKYLQLKGYNPIIICANVRHNLPGVVEIDKGLYTEKVKDGITFVFVKICQYGNNRKKRVLSMIQYYLHSLKVASKLPKPDVIVGSSVHPLACIAANRLAARYGCKSICEIRDLWPESIVAYGILSRKNIITKLLYMGEKSIYKKADAVVMTWPGGFDYIKKQGWEKEIPSEKVFHISNGVDIQKFFDNMKSYRLEDTDLKREDKFKFVYTGSVRPVNNLSILVDAAEILQQRGNERIIILIWGDGNQREELEQTVVSKKLYNIVFKGAVEKKYIPSILRQGDVSVLHNTSTALDEYGQSQNKFFEYLAAGRPILMTYSVGHSVVKERKCGIELDVQTPVNIANAMEKLSSMSREEYKEYCMRAEDTAKEYDFSALTDKLIKVIEK